MIESCACGKAVLDIQGDKITLKADDTIALLTLVNGGQCVKFEHIDCQTCRTISIAESR